MNPTLRDLNATSLVSSHLEIIVNITLNHSSSPTESHSVYCSSFSPF